MVGVQDITCGLQAGQQYYQHPGEGWMANSEVDHPSESGEIKSGFWANVLGCRSPPFSGYSWGLRKHPSLLVSEPGSR